MKSFKLNRPSNQEIGRLLSADNIEIKVLFSSDNPVLLGKTFQSKNIRVWKNKFSMEVCREIVLNSVLDMAVTLKDVGRRYHLTGNVRSCAPLSGAEQYHLDIVLRERADIPTDYSAWNNHFDNNFQRRN